MGNLIARVLESFQQMKDKKILMLGLDAAGKTTTVYKLKLGETVTTIPTIGFNVEAIETRNNVRMTVWDVGGQYKVRKLWKHYFLGTDAVVFIVDSQDKTRIAEAREELEQVMASEEVRRTCKALLVFANKQDLPSALSTQEIVEKMKLQQYGRDCQWYCQGCVATSGEGLYEGIDWLTRVLKN